MDKHTIWNGTQDELLVLVEVLRKHCTCSALQEGFGCAAHTMLFSQRIVDGLLFGRRIVQRLVMEEFGTLASAGP
jgi:hypothetical protein